MTAVGVKVESSTTRSAGSPAEILVAQPQDTSGLEVWS